MPALKNMKHEKFIQLIIGGASQRQAYQTVYPGARRWKDKTVDNRASELFNSGEVQGRYHELRAELDARMTEGTFLARERKRGILLEIAENEELPVSERMKAIDIDNRMSGEYTQKVEVSGLARERSKLDDALRQLGMVSA